MASSDFLRKNLNQHSIKNSISKDMDSNIDVAVQKMRETLEKKYPKLNFEYVKKLYLTDIISGISAQYPQFEKDFSQVNEKSFITPDGGFLYATDEKGNKKLILVAEVKHQGTNDKRANEGLKKQAMGNAIERLGKNLTGIRAIFKAESMIPFICFGSGYDFQEGSTILDRVVTMNDFFPLNKFFVQKENLPFEPVSMFFRYEDWSTEVMQKAMFHIAEEAIDYHFS